MSWAGERVGLYLLQRAGFERRERKTSVGRVVIWEREGEGDPLVLLHGLGARGSRLRPFVEALDRPNPVVLPDFPAHGDSDPPRQMWVPDLVQGVDEALVDLEPAVFYGNSMGGYAAVKIAASRPEQVKGVFVSSPGGGALADEQRQQVMRSFRVSGYNEALALARAALARTPDWKRRLLALGVMYATGDPAVRELVDSVGPHDDLTLRDLRQLRMPTTVVWGTEERLLHPAQREWFRANLPGHASLVEPDGMGHAAWYEHTDELAGMFSAFLDGLD